MAILQWVSEDSSSSTFDGFDNQNDDNQTLHQETSDGSEPTAESEYEESVFASDYEDEDARPDDNPMFDSTEPIIPKLSQSAKSLMATITSPDGWNKLHRAVILDEQRDSTFSTLRNLIKNKPGLMFKMEATGLTPLMLAFAVGNMGIATELALAERSHLIARGRISHDVKLSREKLEKKQKQKEQKAIDDLIVSEILKSDPTLTRGQVKRRKQKVLASLALHQEKTFHMYEGKFKAAKKLTGLPDGILHRICIHLPPTDLTTLFRTCRKMHDISGSHDLRELYVSTHLYDSFRASVILLNSKVPVKPFPLSLLDRGVGVSLRRVALKQKHSMGELAHVNDIRQTIISALKFLQNRRMFEVTDNPKYLIHQYWKSWNASVVDAVVKDEPDVLIFLIQGHPRFTLQNVPDGSVLSLAEREYSYLDNDRDPSECKSKNAMLTRMRTDEVRELAAHLRSYKVIDLEDDVEVWD
ncbi:hypothetical protein HDU97_007867 [Phlyctochytrium planicorne]|nr:hypothetical protein HDU97_007867 [Phlyctochytrium planicorne]